MVREGRGNGEQGGREVTVAGGEGMVADDARPTGTLTHLPSDSDTAFGPPRPTRCVLPTTQDCVSTTDVIVTLKQEPIADTGPRIILLSMVGKKRYQG